MRRLSIIFIVIVSLVLTFSACDKSNEDSMYQTSKEPKNTKPQATNSINSPEPEKTEEPKLSREELNKIDPNNVKESGKLFTGKTDYHIKVNVTSQIVTVYTKDENGYYTVPVKNFICSTGRDGKTPLGEFKIYSTRHEWMLMVDGTYCQYSVRFNGPILFHSIPYKRKLPNTLKWEEFNKLGEPASLGCIRLQAIEAKWIYDNCENGTIVEVFEGEPAEELNALLRPEKVPPNTYWDPTDPKYDGSTPPPPKTPKPKPKNTPTPTPTEIHTDTPTLTPTQDVKDEPTPTPTDTPSHELEEPEEIEPTDEQPSGGHPTGNEPEDTEPKETKPEETPTPTPTPSDDKPKPSNEPTPNGEESEEEGSKDGES